MKKLSIVALLLCAVAVAQPSFPPTGLFIPISASSSAGLFAGTYTSGITATGTIGQTCSLATFNGAGTLAAATVALTGTNTIAGGTALVVTAAGSGYTSAPTSATATNGTATCSGTAVVATSISSAPQGTGWYFNSLAGPITFALPIITSGSIGMQLCFRNTAAGTGVITLKAPASTFIDKAGVLGSASGTLVSGGALGDSVCLLAIDTTHYAATVNTGTWTNN